ncbi:MAG: hypothetical protein EB060_01115 [Proteobacteria bacterium]|nr:hypothetical protein [Pseudomonadota bacterium]
MADVDQIVEAIEANPDTKEAVIETLKEIDAIAPDADTQLEAGELGEDNPELDEKVEQLDDLIASLAEDDNLSPSDIAAIAARVGGDANIKPKTYDHIKSAAERVEARHHGDKNTARAKKKKKVAIKAA